MKRTFSGVLLGLLLVGCGVSEVEVGPEGDALAESEDGLSQRSRTYVAVRRDYRKCAYPYCGGYWVHDVNRRRLNERYVREIDFSASGLSEHDVQLALGAADGELVLRGKLGPIDSATKTQAFLASEAWRGLPGVTVQPGDVFYRAQPRSPAITCVAAPCPTEQATKLNSTARTYFSSYSVDQAAKPLVDKSWLIGRIQNHGALVAGAVVNGGWFAGGFEKVLSANQVFIRLPEIIGPCPLTRFPPCPSGEAEVFSRTPDRCIVPSGCVTPHYCAAYIPGCDEGYTLVSWRSGPYGCDAYACDPSFLVDAPKE